MRRLEVQQRLFELAIAVVACSVALYWRSELIMTGEYFQGQVVLRATNLHIARALKVKHTERADITQTIHVDRKLSKEVDGLRRTPRQGVPKNERRSDDGKEFRKEGRDFHLEELAKLGVHLHFYQLGIAV